MVRASVACAVAPVPCGAESRQTCVHELLQPRTKLSRTHRIYSIIYYNTDSNVRYRGALWLSLYRFHERFETHTESGRGQRGRRTSHDARRSGGDKTQSRFG